MKKNIMNDHYFKHFYLITNKKRKTQFLCEKLLEKNIFQIDSNLMENTKWNFHLSIKLRLLKCKINLKSIQSLCHLLFMTY